MQKNFEFCTSELVWNAKQKVLIEFASNKDLVDALNFGFYMPPSGGRAGKFLDEQRTFKDYPMDRTTGVLEVKVKLFLRTINDSTLVFTISNKLIW